MSNNLFISAQEATLTYPKPHGITIKGFKRSEPDFISHSIKSFSLDVYSGSRIGVVGANGAGKTSLLRLLSGIYIPDSGKVEIYSKINPVIDSGLGFDPFATARSNIVMRCKLDSITEKKEINKIVSDIESFTQLGSKFDQPIYTYSTGMFFRLAFAYATRSSSACAIIDELIGTGDLSFAKKAQERMDNFLKFSSTLIMSSHSTDLLRTYCLSGIYIKSGSVYIYDTIDAAIEQYRCDVENELS
jgi:lipopolysaccharide transport system ATP-binding protein